MKFLEKAYKYSFEGITNNIYQFRFISTGKKDITKIVSLSPAREGNDDLYNLGFGNLEDHNGTIQVNDTSEENNNDYDEVLATVFNCMLHFFHINDKATVLFFGNTVHKHRLYLRKISANIDSLKENFDLLGGEVENLIEITEKEQVVVRNGKERVRKVKEKKLNNEILSNIEVKRIENYIMKNSRVYQFVMVRLKENFEN